MYVTCLYDHLVVVPSGCMLPVTMITRLLFRLDYVTCLKDHDVVYLCVYDRHVVGVSTCLSDSGRELSVLVVM